MKSISTSEANQNFSALTKMVNEEGVVAITKRNKTKYMIMTVEHYEGRQKFEARMRDKMEEGLWVMSQEGSYRRLRTDGDDAQIISLIIEDGEVSHWKIIDIRADDITFVEEDPLTISVEYKYIDFTMMDAMYEDEHADPKKLAIVRDAEKEFEKLQTKDVPQAIFKGTPVITEY